VISMEASFKFGIGERKGRTKLVME
jgi:hypothetical protein